MKSAKCLELWCENKQPYHEQKTRLCHYVDFSISAVALSAGAVEYTDCFSADGLDLPTSVLDMTQNNPMVRFQWC